MATSSSNAASTGGYLFRRSHDRKTGWRAAAHLGDRVRLDREQHGEGGALAGLRAHLDRAAVVLDDPLRYRQAEPRALLFVRKERAEEVVGNPRRDAAPRYTNNKPQER